MCSADLWINNLKTMKKLFLSLIILFTASVSFAQSIDGDWYGVLSFSGKKLNTAFHITRSADGFTATMDSPDQGAMGLPMDKVSFKDNHLMIEFTQAKLTYQGTFVPDSNIINGKFEQGGVVLLLNLGRDKTSQKPADPGRPQDPKSFNYKREEVMFNNTKGGNQLAGTLTLPATGKVSKIVILISGSGPQNRDEEVLQFNHRPFLVWSDWLTKNGIGVLRYDDRGVGKSTGSFNEATTADFADDAEAAVNYIKSRADLKGLSIGLMGHSEGGMIAPMVASRNKDIKFTVLLAAPGIPVAELMVQQNEDLLRSVGGADSVITVSKRMNAHIYGLISANSKLPASELKTKMEATLIQDFKSYPAFIFGGQPIEQFVKGITLPLTQPWMRYFINFSPVDYLLKLKCPTLALNGTLDVQVRASSNLNGIKSALEKGGNKKFEIVSMPGLNHLLQKAVTGLPAEYVKITETVNPAALTKVSTWINAL